MNEDLYRICQKCGVQCCKRGSPMVLPKEREQIINQTKKDVFKKEGNYYILPRPCPFLIDNTCSIHKIRPFDCKIYPCGIIKKDGKFKIGISQICPARTLIDKQFILNAEKEINKLTESQKEDLYQLNIKDEWAFEEHNQNYGQELILDLHGCDIRTFSKENLNKYFVEICKEIGMERHGKPIFWEDHSNIPHLKGISAMHFIKTSNIVIHALDILGAVYINIFSCKKFDAEKAIKFSKEFFRAEKKIIKVIERI
ncbi:MAG: S-adenosylmethionine decarboxylase [Candidatus Nanoarchaeia archaeon]|nr:S-adenosylmethionine decarboxylase [Candidatus Nanoarchaeia archaeon]